MILSSILGKSLVEKRSGEDRRVKKPRKRKHEKRLESHLIGESNVR